MCSVRVPEGVRGSLSARYDLSRVFRHQCAHVPLADPSSAAVVEQRGRGRSLSYERAAGLRQIGPKRVRRRLPHRHDPLLATLPEHADLGPGEVDLVDVRSRSARRPGCRIRTEARASRGRVSRRARRREAARPGSRPAPSSAPRGGGSRASGSPRPSRDCRRVPPGARRSDRTRARSRPSGGRSRGPCRASSATRGTGARSDA